MSLLAQWIGPAFTGAASTNVPDESGNARNGAMGGGVNTSTIQSTAKPGTAGTHSLNFNGSSQYFSVPDLSGSLGNDFTLTAWLKLDAYPPASNSGFGNLGAYDNYGTVIPFTFTQISCTIGTFSNSSTADRAYFADSTDFSSWHHVAITSTPGANGWKFYIDGVLVNQHTGLASIYWGGGVWGFGRSNESGSHIYLDGNLWDVRLYSDTKDATAIAAIMAEKDLSDTDPPVLQSITVPESGSKVIVAFDEDVTLTDATGFALLVSGDAVDLTLRSGDETDELVFDVSRPIYDGETFTLSYNSATGDVEDMFGNALATFSATSGTNNSDSTRAHPPSWSTWRTEAVASARYHGNLWDIGYYNTGNAYGPTDGKGLYEPWRSYRRLADSLGGDSELDDYAALAAGIWIDTLEALGGGGANQAQQILHYSEGLGLEYVRDANTDARDIVIIHQTNGDSRDSAPVSWVIGEEYSREVAYALFDYLSAEVLCGQTHRNRMEYYSNLILGDVSDTFEAVVTFGDGTEDVSLPDGGHIEQWLGNYVTDDDGNYVSGTTNFTATDFAPFMGGLSGYILCRLHEEAANINGGADPDDRTIDKLVRLADAVWNEAWEAPWPGSFYYRPSDNSASAIALNNLVASHWYYLAKITGKQRFVARADEAFEATNGYASLVYRDGGNAPPQYVTKEFAELTRQVVEAWDWRAEAIAASSGAQRGPQRLGLRLGVGL